MQLVTLQRCRTLEVHIIREVRLAYSTVVLDLEAVHATACMPGLGSVDIPCGLRSSSKALFLH